MKRSRLKPITGNKQQRKRADWYLVTKKEYMEANPLCEVPGCGCKASDLHHKAGRTGFLKWYPRFFMAVCRRHHTMIEFTNKPWAELNGYRLRFNMSEHWNLKNEADEWAAERGLS